MADGSGPKDYRLDRLFLELLEQLPTEGRGKLTQLPDEVKRLTEASTVEAVSYTHLTLPTICSV